MQYAICVKDLHLNLALMGSSPPVKRMGVGGPIVVRGRESRLHGEGGQGIDVVLV
jgi:hypothetical protein